MIAFDPGHYAGANKVGTYCEGDTMLKLGLALKNAYNVPLTRETGKNLDFKERAVKAKQAGCDTVISLHTNWPETAKGVIVFYSVTRPQDKAFAEQLGKEIAAAMGLKFRKVEARSFAKDPKTDYYAIIRLSLRQGIERAFIVEHGMHLEFAADVEKNIQACTEAYGRVLELSGYSLYNTAAFPTIRKGHRNNYVSHLQHLLNDAGFNCGAIDGIFGTMTDKAVRSYQSNCGLIVDGIVGPKTWNALLNVHVVKLDPMQLRATLVNASSSAISKIYSNFVNSNFFSGSKTIGWLASEGRILSERDNHKKWLGLYDKPKGTFIVYKDGSVDIGFKTDKDMDDVRNKIYFCCQGFNLNPLNLKKEGFDMAEVGRACNCVMLGYDGRQAVIAVRQGTNAYRSAKTMQELGCNKAIRLDSGGSTNLFVNKKAIFKTSRVLTNIIYWK